MPEILVYDDENCFCDDLSEERCVLSVRYLSGSGLGHIKMHAQQTQITELY